MKKYGNFKRSNVKEEECYEDNISTNLEISVIDNESSNHSTTSLDKYLEEIDGKAESCNCNCDCKEELKILSTKFETGNKILMHKLNTMQKIMGKQNFVIRKLLQKLDPPNINLNIFPINNMTDLQTIDDDIEEVPKNDLIIYIKGILGKTPLNKCIDLFFEEDILLQINWDGSKDKFAISKLKMFNTYIFDAVKSETCGYKEYVDLMRKGIRIAKCRSYKNASRKRIHDDI